MSSEFGKILRIGVFGQSHGRAVGVRMDGLPAGEPLDLEELQRFLDRRAPGRNTQSTARREADQPVFLSGLEGGRTCGAPLCAIIENTDPRSEDYEELLDKPRPSHADYTAWVKWKGRADMRGGGHFSGRLTAPVVAAGAICRQILSAHGVRLATRIARCGGIADAPLPTDAAVLAAAVSALEGMPFPVLDAAAGEAMKARIAHAKSGLDSVGGVLETVVLGLEAGLGEPWFDAVESELAHLLFAVPGVKGVEFGAGFAIAELTGSAANDPFAFDAHGGVCTTTNHSGGVQGGITNGMPVLFRTAVKPTPSIYRSQQTVDLAAGTPAVLALKGRHDPAIVHRARAVVDAVTAFGLVDLAAVRHGTDWMAQQL